MRHFSSSVFRLPAFIGPFISLKAPSLFSYHLIPLSTKRDRQNTIHLLISKLLNVASGIRHQSNEVLCVSFNLYHKPSLLYLLSLCHPIISQVQSEMLKKWKRWKLGKDIDEEYRHTHSHMQAKTGSIAGNLSYLHDNNASEPSGDSPHLNKADRGPSCSAAPEENRRLVVSYSNGTGKGRPTKGRHTLHFSLLPHRGVSSHISTTTEETCLDEKAQCHTYPLEGDETNV